MHVYKGTNNKPIHIFQLQKSITIYFYYICCNFFYRCLLLQVDNLNLVTNLKFYCFYVMLITCKCTGLWKKLDCDKKNGPPYFAPRGILQIKWQKLPLVWTILPMRIDSPKCCFDLATFPQWQLMVAKFQVQCIENLNLTKGIKDLLW